MNGWLPFVLLLAAFVIGLVLVPFGLPGLWLMVAALLGYAALTDFARVGIFTVGAAVLLAALGEAIEAWLGFRFARRYGGSVRAGFGALIGGLIGAIVGTPLPLIGNIVGAFLGAFIGAAVFEYTRLQHGHSSLRAGWGAVLGRVAGAATKIGLGVVIAVVGTYAALVP